MATSTRFAVGVHILAALALQEGKPLTSDHMAASVNTSAPVVRKLLSMMADAGLTTAQLGLGGGALLARRPSEITLLEVYRVMEGDELFAVHRSSPSQTCCVGRNILPVLSEVTCRAQRALETELEQTTLADIVERLKARA